MRPLIESLHKIAPTQANVLVIGESGVGKESIVRALHDLAPWTGGPFVPINCGAIPENLLESELFGYARGAFTGADKARPGRFDAARGGTIFLDEIGDMPISLQVKLLRVLQEKEFMPLGSSERRKADFRVITATNRNLEERVVQGAFRQDLFFRLDVVRLEIPSLRERPMDIASLASHFMKMYAPATLGNVENFTTEAIAMLERHEWPGNIRELENVVHSMLVLKEQGDIGEEDVAAKIHGRILSAPQREFGVELPDSGIDLRDALERMEHQLIRQALQRTEGNRAAAATLLGINRTTLVEKLKRNPVAMAETKDSSTD
jgi:transcriptional regulator with PAS, ATPase and Fis domain